LPSTNLLLGGVAWASVLSPDWRNRVPGCPFDTASALDRAVLMLISSNSLKTIKTRTRAEVRLSAAYLAACASSVTVALQPDTDIAQRGTNSLRLRLMA